ncbi:hypothetical protein EVAR_21108_1 [Eumeta japonica]|uniref:Uncharacterized protein n=1 Tax=Eumeta variegata TaxID=151549 RepID=A0A4C1VW30_EUMVA|nr:hypothetical protein EVAR_21108_1 [Eumeta japonica]
MQSQAFRRFQSGNFDEARSDGPLTDKVDAILESVEQARHISSYNIAEELHELTERNLMNRVLVCDSLLKRNETTPFLKILITSDKKQINKNV